jgi:hypothetical protein
MSDPTPEQLAKLPKWAQEHLRKATEPLLLRLALRWTEPVKPDVPPPDYSARDNLSKGWAVAGSGHYGRVEKACSSSIYHAVGNCEKTTTQGSRSLFSSRLLALRAMRNQAELEYARSLLEWDAKIESEIRTPTAL